MTREEAIKIVKDLYDKSLFLNKDKEAVRTLIPEVEESEDERIRKEIIALFKGQIHSTSAEDNKKYVAWLEKQSTPQVRTGLEWVNTIDDACDKRYSENYAHGEYCHEQSFKWGFQEGVDWFEKQGEEIIPLKEIILNVWELGNYWKELTKGVCNTEYGRQLDYIVKHWKEGEHYIKPFEKQGERPKKHDVCDNCDQQGSCVSPCPMKLVEKQKPADKVEPNFKVGDWIFTEQIDNIVNGPYKIKEVNDDYGYVLDGIRETTLPFTSEHCMRLWTIQDAKPGDVLHCWIDGDEFVLIYKGIKDGYITTYGHLYQKLKSFGEKPTSMFCRTIQGHFTPATKEQCNLLFQKMHEAGYEWNAEKKELKIIDWSKHIKYNPNGPSITKENPAWSEEDEEVINLVCSILYSNFNENEDFDNQMCIGEIIDKLKSLKDRYTWKPSEKQIMSLYNSIPNAAFCERETLTQLYVDLKKLK